MAADICIWKTPSHMKLSNKDKGTLLNGEQSHPFNLFIKVYLALVLVGYKVNMVKSQISFIYQICIEFYIKYLYRLINPKQHSINYNFEGKLNNA